MYEHTFSALSSLAEHKAHFSANSSFFAVVSKYFAFRVSNPSSTSRSLFLASFKRRRVSSSDALASASLAYERNHSVVKERKVYSSTYSFWSYSFCNKIVFVHSTYPQTN